MDNSIALIIFPWKTRQIKRPVEVGSVHGDYVAADVRRLKFIFKYFLSEPPYVGCYGR
jgi:hypothetical protein